MTKEQISKNAEISANPSEDKKNENQRLQECGKEARDLLSNMMLKKKRSIIDKILRRNPQQSLSDYLRGNHISISGNAAIKDELIAILNRNFPELRAIEKASSATLMMLQTCGNAELKDAQVGYNRGVLYSVYMTLINNVRDECLAASKRVDKTLYELFDRALSMSPQVKMENNIAFFGNFFVNREVIFLDRWSNDRSINSTQLCENIALAKFHVWKPESLHSLVEKDLRSFFTNELKAAEDCLLEKNLSPKKIDKLIAKFLSANSEFCKIQHIEKYPFAEVLNAAFGAIDTRLKEGERFLPENLTVLYQKMIAMTCEFEDIESEHVVKKFSAIRETIDKKTSTNLNAEAFTKAMILYKESLDTESPNTKLKKTIVNQVSFSGIGSKTSQI